VEHAPEERTIQPQPTLLANNIAMIGDDHAASTTQKQVAHFPYRVWKMQVGDVRSLPGQQARERQTQWSARNRRLPAGFDHPHAAELLHDGARRQVRHQDGNIMTSLLLGFCQQADVVFYATQNRKVVFVDV